jgi:hypothetical protein
MLIRIAPDVRLYVDIEGLGLVPDGPLGLTTLLSSRSSRSLPMSRRLFITIIAGTAAVMRGH